MRILNICGRGSIPRGNTSRESCRYKVQEPLGSTSLFFWIGFIRGDNSAARDTAAANVRLLGEVLSCVREMREISQLQNSLLLEAYAEIARLTQLLRDINETITGAGDPEPLSRGSL